VHSGEPSGGLEGLRGVAPGLGPDEASDEVHGAGRDAINSGPGQECWLQIWNAVGASGMRYSAAPMSAAPRGWCLDA